MGCHAAVGRFDTPRGLLHHPTTTRCDLTFVPQAPIGLFSSAAIGQGHGGSSSRVTRPLSLTTTPIIIRYPLRISYGHVGDIFWGLCSLVGFPRKCDTSGLARGVEGGLRYFVHRFYRPSSPRHTKNSSQALPLLATSEAMSKNPNTNFLYFLLQKISQACPKCAVLEEYL